MKFFLPQATESEYETGYDAIAKAVKDQLGNRLTERRIFSLDYVHDKKRWHAEVGQLEPQHERYEIVAIFESKPYIIYTREQDGTSGLTILVNNDEITTITDFE